MEVWAMCMSAGVSQVLAALTTESPLTFITLIRSPCSSTTVCSLLPMSSLPPPDGTTVAARVAVALAVAFATVFGGAFLTMDAQPPPSPPSVQLSLGMGWVPSCVSSSQEGRRARDISWESDS